MATIYWWWKWNTCSVWCTATSQVTCTKVRHKRLFVDGNTFILVLSDLTDDVLSRKIEVCEDVIRVYDKINPGETSNRMNALFELNCARIMKAKIDVQQSRLKRQEAIVSSYFISFGRNQFISLHFQDAIDECIKAIRRCYDVLVVETENKRIMDGRLEKILNESFIWPRCLLAA